MTYEQLGNGASPLEHRGPVTRTIKPLYQWSRSRLSGLLIDRPAGIETSREASEAELGLEGVASSHYEPSSWVTLKRILSERDVGPDDVFVDFGSGKGRVVLQAARYPLKRVIGVELSAQLTEVARANVERLKPDLRCTDIQLVTADAADFAIPDDVTVAYFYNSLRGEAFSRVIANLIASVDRNPRRLRIIYRTPLEEDRLTSTGRVTLVRRRRGLRPGSKWAQANSIHLYELVEGPPSSP